MDESSTCFAVGWQLSSGGIFEAFDDGRFAGAIVSHYESEGTTKLDRLTGLLAERANSELC